MLVKATAQAGGECSAKVPIDFDILVEIRLKQAHLPAGNDRTQRRIRAKPDAEGGLCVPAPQDTAIGQADGEGNARSGMQ